MNRYEAALDEMEERPDGDFLLFDDHLAALAQHDEELRERVKEPVAKAVERMAGPLGRARSRALDGVSDADQMRDLDIVADGVKELRDALEDSGE